MNEVEAVTSDLFPESVPQQDPRDYPAGLMLKDTSADMSLDDFAKWIEDNIGMGIAQALQQTAIMLCCDVISQDIGKATPRLRRRTGPKTSSIVEPDQHWLAKMLALQPNRRHTWTEYTEMTVYWHCLTQNAVSYIVRNSMDDPLELIPLQSTRVRELVNGRAIFYELSATTLQEQALLGASSMRVPERDVIHVRGRMLDGMDGYSTLEAGKSTIATGKEIDKFRGNLFAEEGQLRGVFTRPNVVDEAMPDTAFERLRQQYKVLMSRFRQLTEPIVLEGGLEFKSISSNPKDMEFVAQFNAQLNAVCRLFRVPPHKIFNMDGVKYENLETSEKMYVGDTLVPVCKRFEDRMGRCLLTEQERLDLFVEYDRDEMTLRDPQREMERVVKTTERGILMVDEARAALGYNELPNGAGKVRLIPTNMSVVDEAGEVVIAGSSTAKPGEEKPESEEKPEKGAPALRIVSN